MPWLPQGNGNLAYWSALLPLPVVGIAGMNAERTAQAVHSGASGVAVITAITSPGQETAPEVAIAQLQAAYNAGETSKRATPIAAPALPQSTIFAST
jgi:thiamine monophosphate synthase